MSAVISALFLLFFTTCVIAELSPMQDDDLGRVSGEGLELALRDFSFEADASAIFTINDIKTPTGVNVPISVSEFYIAAPLSNKGQTVAGFDWGAFTDPFSFSMISGSTAAGTPAGESILQLKFPDFTPVTSRPDIGARFEMNISGGTDVFNIDLTNVQFDGSYARIWGDPVLGMVGQLNLNIIVDDFYVQTSSDAGNVASELFMDNYRLNLALGYGSYQPVNFKFNPDGNFQFTLSAIPGTATEYNDFYNNAPQSNFFVDEIRFGTHSFGSSRVEGISVQYLKVTSQDI